MFNSSVLEIAIGLIFIYLLLSVICTSINEAISSFINQRGKNLFVGIKNLLNDPSFNSLAQHVYNHGLVSGSTQYATQPTKPDREPSYLAPNVFSSALLDILGSQGAAKKWQEAQQTTQTNLTTARANLTASQNALANNPQDQALQKARDEAQDALVQAEADAKQARDKQPAAKAADDLYQAATKAAAGVKGFGDLINRPAASAALQKALTAGRALDTTVEQGWASLKCGVLALQPGHTQEALLVFIHRTEREVSDAKGQLQALQTNVEQWFNDAMDRIGGWYKRWTQIILFSLAAFVVCATNADTINILRQLDQKGPEVGAIVTAAEDAAKAGKLEGNDVEAATAKLELPLGWSTKEGSSQQFPTTLPTLSFKVVGLLVSIFAVSLGAPFWFDTLSKFVNLRGAGTPPGESKKSAPNPTSTKHP